MLYVRPSRIHRRRFDPKGKEIEPNFSNTRKVNTGFLMSSFSTYRCSPGPSPHPCPATGSPGPPALQFWSRGELPLGNDLSGLPRPRCCGRRDSRSAGLLCPWHLAPNRARAWPQQALWPGW